MTEAVIDGTIYNTETAIRIGSANGGTEGSRDVNDWVADVFVTKKGPFVKDAERGAPG